MVGENINKYSPFILSRNVRLTPAYEKVFSTILMSKGGADL
jgi:hypothetical protein